MFSKDKDNNYIVVFKYITTSITLSILDIEDISYGKDNLLSLVNVNYSSITIPKKVLEPY